MTVSRFSSGTMRDLIKRYPHVSERDFNYILNEHANIKQTDLYSDDYIIQSCHVMELEEDVADEYQLPYEIELATDKEGIIYYTKDDLKKDYPLLKIELQNESSVPKVFYKGEEITNKVNVHFDWDTEDAVSMGGLTYGFEHIKDDGAAERIERRTKGHR